MQLQHSLPSSPSGKPKKSLTSQKSLSANGLTMDSVLPSEPQEASASLGSQVSLLPPQGQNTGMNLQILGNIQETTLLLQNRESVIAASRPRTKKTTSGDKLTSCNSSSQTTASSPMLHPELISSEKASVPFWSSRPKEWCQKLWLPTGTGCAASPLTSWSGSFASMESNSWFSIKAWSPTVYPEDSLQSSQRTSWPSLTFSIAESMVNESTKSRTPKERKTGGLKKSKKPPASRVRRVRLYPNHDDTKILRRWFGCVRKTYNWALAAAKAERFLPVNVPEMRKRFVTADAIPQNLRYLLNTPKHVRDGALDDLSIAYKSNLEKRKKNPEHTFEVAFRSKKESQSIVIPSTAIKLLALQADGNTTTTITGSPREMSMYPTYLTNRIKYHVRRRDARLNKVIASIDYDCRLVLDKLGRFYLCIPQCSPGGKLDVPACDNQASSRNSVAAARPPKDCREEWCALDPGVKTFQTVYCPTPGVAFKIGDKDMSRIYRMGRWVDQLVSRRTTLKGVKGSQAKRQRRRIDRALVRGRNRIKNLVLEVHWKTVHFLVTRFQRVIIPPFNVQNMVVKSPKRRINSVTVRKMLQWSHAMHFVSG